MHFISKIVAALLCILLAASPAGSGSMMLLGVGKAGATLPGPPVFTFQDIQQKATSDPTTETSASLAIGAANANRRVYIVAMEASQGTVPQAATSASFNAGAIPADVFTPITSATNAFTVYFISAIVPTGATCTVTLTFGSTPNSSTKFAAYTVDTTTLNSINPVVTANNVVTAATANPTSANTFGIATSTAGSAILAAFYAQGISTGTQTISSSDASLANDGQFGDAMVGHANSAPVSAQSNVNTTWTTAGNAILALAVFR